MSFRPWVVALVLVGCEATIPDGDPADPCLDTPGFTPPHAVALTARSESGQVLVGAVAEWRVDLTTGSWLPCTEVAQNEWLCGPDITGRITVQVSAPGHEAQQLTPVVTEDQCGDPILRYVDLVLPGAPCPPASVPAVEAVVFGRLVDSFVSWRAASGADDAWARCALVDRDPARFYCAENTTGLLEVGLFTEGVLAQSQTVDVYLDRTGCFPVTESVSFRVGED